MSLMVHHAARADALAAGLAASLESPLGDPFATEVVSVPSPGVERWLSQTLSHLLGATSAASGDGVCAGVEFPRLDPLLRRLVEQACGIDPATDPWHPERGTWSLLALMEQSASEPWFHAVGAQLTGDHRFLTARRVFGLFSAYAGQRPEMLERWRDGELVDAAGVELTPFVAWQAHLWRRLVERLEAPDPVLRLRRACSALRADPAVITLPERLAVFGPTRLQFAQVDLLRALADQRRVELWLPHPSPALWQAVAEREAHRGPRRLDTTAVLPRHPLNARLGRDARELQVLLAGVPARSHDAPPEHPKTLLQRLQAAVHADRPGDAVPLDPTDRSVRFHASHGPDRQVEVLREVVLGLLADDPTLEPRDLIVMCPDIETFAPLISAAFALDGADDEAGHPGQRLRVRLADRSLREVNPLLNTLSTLLDLGGSRATASDLRDLCADPPIARRFGFGDNDLERLAELVDAAAIRWGLDGDHRARFSLPGFTQNTWASGLDRMLLGVALGDEVAAPGGTLPLADVDSSDVDVVGRLAELVARVREVLADFSGRRPLPEWIAACRRALDLLTATSPADAWQQAHAYGELADIAASASADDTVELSLGDLRGVLADAFAGRPSRANFRTGALTMCTLTPMRSVPHRAVIVLGPDDGVFPRRTHVDGDDLLAADPWVGDRDPRSEDRQVLLDALLAARDHFVVVYAGASPNTGMRRPASIPVQEVRDAAARLCAGDPWPALEVRHPLQPFSPANFSGERPLSFDRAALRAAEASLGPRTRTETTYALSRLPKPAAFEADPAPVELSDLTSFYAHPARFLLRHRAGLFVSQDDVLDHRNDQFDADEAPPADELPITLDGLQQWAIGARMLEAHLSGAPLETLLAAERLRGDLPPGVLGDEVLTRLETQVRHVAGAAARWLDEPARSTWVRAALGPYALTGVVAGVRGTTAVQVQFGRVRGNHRMQSWLRLLALSASQPGVGWTSVVVGKGDGYRVGPVAESDARSWLKQLIDVHVEGCRKICPLPPRTAAALADDQQGGVSRWAKPNKIWPDQEHDAAWARFLGPSYGDLCGVPGPRGGSAFKLLAERLWTPLKHHEEKLS